MEKKELKQKQKHDGNQGWIFWKTMVLNIQRSKENNWERSIYYGNPSVFGDHGGSSLSRKETGDRGKIKNTFLQV